MDDVGTSTYYIGGFDRCSKEVLHMAALVACTSHISDNTLLRLLEDDRLPTQMADIVGDFNVEIEYTMGLTASVLQLVCQCVGMFFRALKDQLVQCVAV